MRFRQIERQKILFRFLKDNGAFGKYMKRLYDDRKNDDYYAQPKQFLIRKLSSDTLWKSVICASFNWPIEEFAMWDSLNNIFEMYADDLEKDDYPF